MWKDLSGDCAERSAGGDRIVIIERQTNILPPLLQGKESERGWITHKARCEATSIWRPPL
ncbi:hypothetical protein SD81_040525 [Tolypothrix campylonemoides VB511288]|nr:hypothetical protein SD81_040525 [Tolypothrix campylonemoides VB511288]